MSQVKVSVISSAFNEEENVPILSKLFDEFNRKHNMEYELVFVDDGSKDNTYANMIDSEKKYAGIKTARHRKNFGKTEGILTGLKASSGSIVAIYDTDMQYSLDELPRMVERIEKDGYDICTGWKQGKYAKAFVSKVYNKLSRMIFNLPIHDQNGLKVLKKEIFSEIHLRKEWHRYIISLAVNKGFTVCEEKVELREREHGVSKYGNPFRVFIGIFDMMTVKFVISFLKKPMLLFGVSGALLMSLGVLTGIAALILRFGFNLGFRPLLYLVMLLILSGLLVFAIGFIAELMAIIFEEVEDIKRRGK
ncbi:MAG: glycosyltransferase family 2 protein [bacterium]|nr:glycosyltransferase family 2 protein [bacterium]